jgi:hypothetical protein
MARQLETSAGTFSTSRTVIEDDREDLALNLNFQSLYTLMRATWHWLTYILRNPAE